MLSRWFPDVCEVGVMKRSACNLLLTEKFPESPVQTFEEKPSAQGSGFWFPVDGSSEFPVNTCWQKLSAQGSSRSF